MEALNTRLGTEDWRPVILVKRPVAEQELAAMYRDADVALVLPLRDGMNLTGKVMMMIMMMMMMMMMMKEFVSCRIDRGKPGVLLLSPFIGAAEIMQEALSVNPYEVSKVADYLHR